MSSFIDTLVPHALLFALAFARVSSICLSLPGVGERTTSTRIKVLLCVVFSISTYFSLNFENTPIPRPFLSTLLIEITVGILIGLILRLFILSIQTAGTIAAQSTSLSQILGSAGIDPMPAIGHVLVIGGVCLALTNDLHVKALTLFVRSYQLFPLGQGLLGADVGKWGSQNVSSAFSLAFTLAAPFIVLSLLYNVVLGVINKAMPQLMVAFVGAPFITFGGLFLLFATVPIMLATWLSAFDAVLANPVR